MQQQLLLAVGAAVLAVFNEEWGTLWCPIAALCRRSKPAGHGQYSTRNERGEKRTLAAPWLMREQPAVLCQHAKVSSFSVITALASYLLSACETKLMISCESRWF